MTTPTDMNGVQPRHGDVCQWMKRPGAWPVKVWRVESDSVVIETPLGRETCSFEYFSTSYAILLPHPPSMPLDSTGRPLVIGQKVRHEASGSVATVEMIRPGSCIVAIMGDGTEIAHESYRFTIIHEPPTSGEAARKEE